jgi:hypothetical protein
MFPDALALPMPAEEGTGVNVASTGNGAPKNAGSIAQVTFTALVDLGDATTIVLTAGKYSTGGATQSLEIGSGGATLVVGGTPVQAEKTPDFTGDGKVDFSDFVQFAQNFGKSQGDPGYDARFDLNDDNKVDFGDFVTFAQSFGRPVTKPVGQAEPVGSSPGLNADADLSLVSEPGEVCDEVTVLVRLSNATQVSGYSLKLVYDPSSLEWLGSEGAVASLFTDDGGVALDHRPQPGNATLADMLDAALSNDDAELVRIRFRVIGTTPGSVVIQEALVSDISGRIDRLTGARLDGIRALPSRYAVLQNAPNPFNPSTEIAFQLPEAGEVSLAVYNLLGQQVRTLAAGRHHAGYHRVVWDGRDAAGRSVSSGVYLYRFVSEGLTETRQMLLLK